MTGLTREAIVKALHDKGAYCGVCDYETALDGTPGCSECRQVLEGYADAILALAPTVDRDTIDRKLSEVLWNASNHPSPVAVLGKSIDPLRTKCVDAVTAAIPGPTVAEVKAQALREAATAYDRDAISFKPGGWGSNDADVQTINLAAWSRDWLRNRASLIEAGGRP